LIPLDFSSVILISFQKNKIICFLEKTFSGKVSVILISSGIFFLFLGFLANSKLTWLNNNFLIKKKKCFEY